MPKMRFRNHQIDYQHKDHYLSGNHRKGAKQKERKAKEKDRERGERRMWRENEKNTDKTTYKEKETDTGGGRAERNRQREREKERQRDSVYCPSGNKSLPIIFNKINSTSSRFDDHSLHWTWMGIKARSHCRAIATKSMIQNCITLYTYT